MNVEDAPRKQEALTLLASADEVMAVLIEDLPYPLIESSGNLYHDLIGYVIEQQIHYRSTRNTFGKLLAKAGLTELTPEGFDLFVADGLEGYPLSARKLQTVQLIHQHVAEQGEKWDLLSLQEQLDSLASLKGVGKKVIENLRLFTLSMEDVFPVDDYHIQKIIPQLYEIAADRPLIKEIRLISEHWAPYRSLAFLYLLEWQKDQNS